jgi:membrane protease YdiL (CAAX protease family)
LGIVISSIMFATMHSGYQSVPYLLYVFSVALFLGVSFYRTKSLAYVTLIHGVLNFFLFSFLPYGYLRIF